MTPVARPQPTPAELIEGGNDLLYEVQMLFNTAELLEDSGRWGPGWDQRTLYMATLESFLVHARSLMDFLCTRSAKIRPVQNKGVFGFDYCSIWDPEPWDGDEWKAISEQIVHMSYRRPDIGRRWAYADMLSRLKVRLARFLDTADGLHEHVKDQLRGVLDGAKLSVAQTPESIRRGAAAGAPDIAAATVAGMPRSVPTTTLIDPSLVIAEMSE
jgi:hypothetical protein